MLNHVYRDLPVLTSRTSSASFPARPPRSFVTRPAHAFGQRANATRVTVTAGGQPIVSLAGHVRLTASLNVSEWR